MSDSLGSLSFDAVIRDSQFLTTINSMERRIIGLSNTAVRENQKIDDSFKRLGQLAVGAFAFSGLSDLPQQLIKVRGEFQQLEIAYTVLLRSKEKADKLLSQATQFAAKTPFELGETAQASKQLLAYGVAADNIIPTLTKLGDIASGVSIPLADISYLYGTTLTQGRLYSQDLNQFVGRGIPLIQELARQFKVSDSEVRKLVEDGKVGFSEVDKALTSLVDGTGRLNFGGLMAEQAKSLTGLTSNLSDAWNQMLNQIGKDNQDLLASIIQGATGAVQNYEQILDILKVVIATYGTYKAAVLALSVAQAAANVAGNVQAWLSLASTIRSAKDAQIAFNLATSANPWALAATAIVGLITAVAVYKKELSSAEQAELDIAEARKAASDGVQQEVSKIELLKATINNEKLSREARNKALKELIALSPQHLNAITLESVKTAEGAASINNYVEAVKRKLEYQRLDAKLTESLQRQSAAQRGEGGDPGFFTKLSFAAAAAGGEGTFDYSKAVAEASKKNREQIIKDEQLVQEQILKEKKALDESGQVSVKTEQKKQAARAVTVEQIEAEIKAKKESLSLDNSDAKNASIRQQIDDLEKAKRRLTGEKTKAEKDADKVGPFGSISYWEEVARKADEIISKTKPTDTATLSRQAQIKFDAEQKAEELRKAYAKKSFEDELADKKQKYEAYQQWVSAYGKQAADTQYGDLIRSGQSFLDYLNTQIEQLQNQKENVGLTDKEAANLNALFSERDAITGKKSAIDAFNESLQTAQQSAGSLAEYLSILKQKQDELSAKKAVSADDFSIRKQLAEEINQVQSQLKSQLDQFLTSYASSGQQQLSIQKRYADLRLALDKQYNGQRTAAYQQALAVIDAAEKQEFTDFQQRKLEETAEYKKTTQVIVEEGRKALRIQIENQTALVSKAKELFGVNSEAYKKAKKDLDALTNSLSSDTTAVIGQFASQVGQLGQELQQMGGNAAVAGSILVSLASNVTLISQAFQKGTTDAQKYGIAAQGLINLFTTIASAAQQRKQKEEEYYRAVIGQQQQYNLLLNEQLGLQAKSKENVFVKDYVGELEDGFKKYNDAQDKYQQSLKKLQQGRAKVGLQTVDDKATGLQIIGGAAATGAAIGAIVGPAGAAVGAVIGGIVGGLTTLFGGSKKKADEFGSLLATYPALIQKSKDGVDQLNTALAETLIQQGLVDDTTKELLQSTIDWQKQMDEAKEQIKSIVGELAGNLGNNLRDSLVNAFEEGTDAAKAFSSSVSAILEDMVTRILFSKAFGSLFDQLQTDLSTSLNVAGGGDGNVIDDFERFTQGSQDALNLYNQWLKQFQDAAAKSGFDVLKPNAGTTQTNSLSGAIKGVTEETASVLAGQINAIRISQADTNGIIRQQLLVLNNIDRNTSGIARTNELLDSMDRRLKNIESDPLRAKGGG